MTAEQTTEPMTMQTASKGMKEYARKKVSLAVKRGVLIRATHCERCGTECFTEGSHDDYSKALEVEWLCVPCHRRKDLTTHCKQGHEWNAENTYYRNGKVGLERDCRACMRARSARYAARKKARLARKASS